MSFPRLLRGCALALSAFVLAACGGGGDSGSATTGGASGPGTLRVSLTDAPACGYDHVYVTVSRVRVHASSSAAEGDGGWADITLSPAQRIDLLALTNGVLYTLGQTALPAGTYQQMRLVLAENSAAAPLANAVVPTGGVETALDTPSAQQSGLKMQANIQVPAGNTLDVVIDFDACKSVVRRGNSGQYNLKPVLTVIPLVSVGAISGYVKPEVPAVPVTVSAQVGGVVVKSTVAGATGQFKLAPIASGTYDVVVTAPARTTYVVTGVPVVTGGDTTLTAAPGLVMNVSSTGIVDGQVSPAAASALVRALQAISSTGKVEVGFTNADTAGAYSLTLPTAQVQLASWLAPIAPATVPVLTFAPYGTGGAYTLEASATGYLTQTAPVTVGAVKQTVNFTLPVK